MRHFNYYENGGPFPSACVSCGANKRLFGLTRELLSGGEAQICETCVKELALFIGWSEEAPLLSIIDIKNLEIDSLSEQLNKVPDHVEELINGIRSSVTDFVFAVSYGDNTASEVDAKKPELSVSEPSASINNARKHANPPIKPSGK